MKVFKFGGASVKNASAIENVGKILKNHQSDKILVVVSAMDKTTNRLEECVNYLFEKNVQNYKDALHKIHTFHKDIALSLFGDSHPRIYQFMHDIFQELSTREFELSGNKRAFIYDQIVSTGEVLSSYLIHEYLLHIGITSEWWDARRLVRTDNHFQEANVNWEKTEELIKAQMLNTNPKSRIYLTQGFIGNTLEGTTTTLGREGSDYSAAIFAYGMGADSVTIWKDVPGMLNADPKYFKNTQLLEKISYREAIELAYFGASVIHPKTIKPLQNKNIPLYVRSFIEPELEGTCIQNEGGSDHLIPSYIVKKNEILLTISAVDFSFINEDALAKIFEVFYALRVKINLMQNSALNFSVLVDGNKVHIETLIDKLKPDFVCKYNEGVELVTIRHYNDGTIKEVIQDREILLEQRSRQTARFVIR